MPGSGAGRSCSPAAHLSTDVDPVGGVLDGGGPSGALAVRSRGRSGAVRTGLPPPSCRASEPTASERGRPHVLHKGHPRRPTGEVDSGHVTVGSRSGRISLLQPTPCSDVFRVKSMPTHCRGAIRPARQSLACLHERLQRLPPLRPALGWSVQSTVVHVAPCRCACGFW